MIHHYTTEFHFPSIIRDGFIMPATTSVVFPEKPAVWFSSEPIWEPTANKGVVTPSGTTRNLTSAEMFAMIDLFRFSVDRSRALPWHQLVRKARIKPKLAATLVKIGHAVGANHLNWYGILEPVEVCTTNIQMWNGKCWVDAIEQFETAPS